MDKRFINVGVLLTDSAKPDSKKPFWRLQISRPHIVFSKIAKENRVRLFFSHYKQYSKGGILRYAWYYDKGWKKAYYQEIDIVYSRFAKAIYEYDRKKIRAENFKYKMAEEIPTINHPSIDQFCWDKTLVHEVFPEHTPKTYLINTKKGLKIALSDIKTEKYVLKPRYGSLGVGVQILNKNEMPYFVDRNSIVQEFVDSSNGIKGITSGVHDLRLIIINGKIDHAFIRLPKKNKLIANVALGAKKVFIDVNKVPVSARKIVKKIDNMFSHFKPRLYAIDFMFDKDGKPYIVECNSQPMINKYAYGKAADLSYYVRLCNLFKSGARLKVEQIVR